MSIKLTNEAICALQDNELLAIIHSTNPHGALKDQRIIAMDEWDRRHPVGALRGFDSRNAAISKATT